MVQCGGPTAVINASLAAVIEEWHATGRGMLYGARHGLQGVAHADWVSLEGLDATTLNRLANQTGAALGSGRHLLHEAEIPGALTALFGHGIETLFLIGGNGTMTAAVHLAEVSGGRLQVIGIPKTIDNDVAGTEVAPGFLSAARFTVRSVYGTGLDLCAMSTFDDVAIVEVMGRHSGWLTAAAGMAAFDDASAPHLLLLPEVPVDEDALLNRIAAVHRRLGICLVAASEGSRDAHGAFLAEKTGQGGRDAAGQRLLSLSGGTAAYLAELVRSHLGLRCRQTRPDTLYRSHLPTVDPLDRHLAKTVGDAAVRLAREGETLVMAGLRRQAGGWHAVTVPFADVVGKENPLPREMFDSLAMHITDRFRIWAADIIDTPPSPVAWI